MMGFKITLVGGASSYTPELFANLTEQDWQHDIQQITLYDPNLDKVGFIAGVCKRLLKESHREIEVTCTQNRQEAISGADFIVMQIRVGGLTARVRDERLPLKLGLVGN